MVLLPLLFLLSLALQTGTGTLTIIHNARRIESPTERNATAICFSDSTQRILAIGSLAQVRDHCDPTPTSARSLRGNQRLVQPLSRPRYVDVQQRVVFPGLIDSHMHLLYGGFKLVRPQLDDCNSVDDVIERLREYVGKHRLQPGDWIQGFGWDQNRFPSKQFPTRWDLDKHFPDHPIWLQRIDGHASWANSATLDRIPPLPDADPTGGRVVRDGQGRPTGIFTDTARALVQPYVPLPTDEENDEAVRAALRECAKHGLTAIHDPGIDLDQAEIFKRFVARGDMTLRQYAMWLGSVGSDLGGNVPPSTPMVEDFMDQGRFQVKAVKFFADGALGSYGAALLEPYSDNPAEMGQLRQDPRDYLQNVTAWAKYGYQIATHAIGDRANRMVIEAYEHICAGKLEESPHLDLRLRIEHFQIVNVTDIPRIRSRSGSCMIASMQPTHATSDMTYAVDRLGPTRLHGAYAWRSVLNETSTTPNLAFGSDWPTVGVVPPVLGFYAAITRQDQSGQPEGGWLPEQRVTRQEALASYTTSAAFAAFHEHDMGSLEVGKFADMIVLDEDWLDPRTSPREILKSQVLATFSGGRTVWESPCFLDPKSSACNKHGALHKSRMGELLLKRVPGGDGCPH